jgi:collagen type III alpha
MVKTVRNDPAQNNSRITPHPTTKTSSLKMKNSKITLAVAALSLATLTAFAQNDERPRRPGGGERPDGPPPGERGFRPDGERGPGGPPDGPRGFGGPRDGERGFGGPGGPGGRFMSPIMQALDANADGVIDEAEIDGAVIALKKLDKNGDRRLTQDELRPAGFGGGPGGPGFGGPRPEGERGFGGPRPEGGPGGPGRPGGPDMVARLMENDKNGDGKLSKEELPERMQQNMERLDTNGDGFVDRGELEAMSARFRGPGGPGGGPGGPDGRRPGGPRPDGDQPGRPVRPPADQ